MASVITQSVTAVTKDFKEIKFACTAHTDGTFTAVDTDGYITKMIRGWFLYKFSVVIGATAPTAASDMTLKDPKGVDLLGGQGTDKITGAIASTLENYPKINDQAANQPVMGALTLAITNNSVSAAVFDVYCIFKRANA